MKLSVVQGLLDSPEIYDVEHVWGLNPDVDQASPEDLIDGGGDLVVPASAGVVHVVSADADDDGNPADTGARTVRVYGLDANYEPTSETVTINGTTPVATTETFTRVFGAEVVTAGSSGFNEGAITVKDATDTYLYATIVAEANRSYQGHYTIPAGYYGYVLSVDTLNDDDCVLMVKDYDKTIWTPVYKINSGTNNLDYPIQLAPKTDIKFRTGTVSANDTSYEAYAQVLLKQI